MQLLADVPEQMTGIRFFKIAVSDSPIVHLFKDFDNLDPGHTGRIERQSFLDHALGDSDRVPAWEKLEAKTFVGMDTDRDGAIDKVEYQAAYDAFETSLSQVILAVDTNKDNKVSYVEMHQMTAAGARNMLSFMRYIPPPDLANKAEL